MERKGPDLRQPTQEIEQLMGEGHVGSPLEWYDWLLLSEKISGTEGTKLDEDFMEMERKIEVTNKSVLDLLSKTTEYLQPNPGGALVDIGEAMRQMADVKDSLDISVKQNFIDPLQNLQDKDLKEITHHLKKLEGRRLDFDYKKKRHGKVPDEEIRQAVEKFEESKELAERSMFNFLENDVEQVSQLSALVEAALDYHRQSLEILEDLNTQLQTRQLTNYSYHTPQSLNSLSLISFSSSVLMISSARSRPKREIKQKSIMSSIETIDNTQHNGLSYSSSLKSSDNQINHTVNGNGKTDPFTTVPLSWPESPTFNGHQLEVLDQPCARALYDFEPENDGELGFKEGDIIILTNQIDDNWYEGMINGDSGFFPINYVEVIVPLPQ
ncbi:unnamed protein product [Coregonus sp. 'balchen']|nr:unnamed protein product [Coregonus sp. 'balchen']